MTLMKKCFLQLWGKMNSKYLILPFLGVLISFHSYAKFDGEVFTKKFSVKIGGSRVIYNEDSSGKSVLLMNPQDYPILVESRVLSEDKKEQSDFIVTPPLMKLDANQQSRVRVIKTDQSKGLNHETLQWLCFNAIPPKNSDEMVRGKEKKTTIDVSLTINTCDKLIFRPNNLDGTPETEAGKLKWVAKNNVLTVINPTPFYMNLSSIYFGGKVMKNGGYIPPFQSKFFKLDTSKEMNISWDIINDHGGISKKYSGKINDH